MKARYDKLIVVRAAASRLATASFVESATHVAGQEALVRRLADATAALTPETGLASGAGLAARGELAGRMQAALRNTQRRLEDRQAEHGDSAVARQAARRALDSAVDIRRIHAKACLVRAEAKFVPTKPKGPTS
jgi:hypothetical protein